MSSRWLLLGLALGCARPVPRPQPSMDPGRLDTPLLRQFTHAAAAWNRGDLEAFMADYPRDSTPTYVAGTETLRGYDAIRGRYAPSFAPGARRDSLRFENFSVRPISGDYALVTARFILYANGRTTASGPFTLLMHRRPEGWKILHDHSSSD